MAESYELDPADRVRAGVVGEPGQRTFHLQAWSQGTGVTVVVEKEHVTALATLAERFPAVPVRAVDTADGTTQGPLFPAWRAGSLALSGDPDGERFVLEAGEAGAPGAAEGGGAVTRLRMGRATLAALVASAVRALRSGARPVCRFCGEVVASPVHLCATMDGHATLTV